MDLIAIPSSGRPKRQQTLYALYKTGVAESYPTAVVVYEHEAEAYDRMAWKGKRIKNIEIITVPRTYKGIARKRQFILTELATKRKARNVLMLDDDLSFCWRPDISKDYMGYINDKPLEMHMMVETLTEWLEEGFAHVGLISRQANRNTGVWWQEPGRAMNAHAYDTHVIRNLVATKQLSFCRVPVMEDFDLTLQLLRLGFPNRISCQFAWTTYSNLPGGCSNYRTPKMQKETAELLAKLHPGLVQVVAKKAKTWKGFTERYDVRVQWRKALQQGQQPRKRAA